MFDKSGCELRKTFHSKHAEALTDKDNVLKVETRKKCQEKLKVNRTLFINSSFESNAKRAGHLLRFFLMAFLKFPAI